MSPPTWSASARSSVGASWRPSVATRDHGAAQPRRAGLPGRHPVGEPGGGGRRAATLAELTPIGTRGDRQAIDDGIRSTVEECGASMARVGSMFTIFFWASAPEPRRGAGVRLRQVRSLPPGSPRSWPTCRSQYEAAFLPSTSETPISRRPSTASAVRCVPLTAPRQRISPHVLRRWTPRRSKVLDRELLTGGTPLGLAFELAFTVVLGSSSILAGRPALDIAPPPSSLPSAPWSSAGPAHRLLKREVQDDGLSDDQP